MNFILIFISALLYTLSFPKFSLWWLSFICLIPLFIVIKREPSLSKQIFFGFLWSSGMTSGMGYWVFHALLGHFAVPLPKALLFFSLCFILPMGLIFLFFVLLFRYLNQERLFFYAFVVPSAWVFVEYTKELIPIMIPWGSIGYAIVDFSTFIQIADIIGIYGVTFLVVMINALLFYSGLIWRNEKISTNHRMAKISLVKAIRSNRVILPLSIVCLLILIPVGYGINKISSLEEQVKTSHLDDAAMQAVLVQGNFSLKERWSGMGFYHRIKSYLEMSGIASENKKRVIVWPETTLNSSTHVNNQLFKQIMNSIGEHSLLISGGLNESNRGEMFNCAYIISGKGRLFRYDKHILLPYSETSPLIDLLDQYYSAPSQFSSGRTSSSVQTTHGCLGVSICFEILYPGYIRRSVKEGAEFLVNISNDSWFGNSAMPYNHFNASRLRAIENGRFLLRTSNSGISAVIGPDGVAVSESSLFRREKILADFRNMKEITLYTMFGDWFLYVSVILLLAALVIFVIKE